jgi:hypothetical protein
VATACYSCSSPDLNSPKLNPALLSKPLKVSKTTSLFFILFTFLSFALHQTRLYPKDERTLLGNFHHREMQCLSLTPPPFHYLFYLSLSLAFKRFISVPTCPDVFTKEPRIRATTLCVGVGLFHGFVTVYISRVECQPHAQPPTERPRIHFWLLPFDLPTIGGSTRSLRSRQHSSSGH